MPLDEDEACEKPCPVDCVVSEWSNWSHCSPTCGLGRSFQRLGDTNTRLSNHLVFLVITDFILN